MESSPSLPIKPELMDSFNQVSKRILHDLDRRGTSFKQN